MRKSGVVIVVLSLLALPVWATQDILDAAIAEYPFIDGTRLDTCSLCHAGVPALNPYGTDLDLASLNFDAIEGDDSDDDGFSNLVEITALTFPGNDADSPPITVPDVVGLTQAAAETAITALGLTVGNVSLVANDTVPEGEVISQDPEAGTEVAAGASVDLTVSSGPAAITVPDVVGLTEAAATTAITGAGLTLGTVTQEASDTVPAGEVISQLPTAGTQVAPDSEVSITVSAGPNPVTVPDVVGLAQAAASTAITNAGLTVGAVTTAPSNTVPAGSVISQSPVAGAMAAPGADVDLVVSTGPGTVTVPDVVGETQAAAQTAITNAGLTVGTITQAASNTVPAGSVISQAPASGTEVAAGSAVNLTVSTGPAGGTGTLQVNIEPQAARDLGAEWRVDNGPFRESGDIVTLAAGVHTVSFRDIGCDGFSGCFAGCTKQFPGTFSGSPQFDALAKAAVNSYVGSLDAEKQGGCFEPCLVDFQEPSDEVITIVAGQPLVITATYTEVDKTAAASAIGSFGGDTIVLAFMIACLVAAHRIRKSRNAA